MIGADEGKNFIHISIISIVEILYLAERFRIPIDLEFTRSKIQTSSSYQIIDLDIEIVNTARFLKNLELHDRLIVATAKYLDVPILTSDMQIAALSAVEVIWL
ncbi:PIN domain-containing protein [candidate division KSB1 bacterium]|nr:PIN domain-containing protein [candidate division KSB1 bacterium]